ncbi:MAG TPA: site-specific integrase, partial [Myxococcota bacterium]|nr:site-specific integrase [Myxococcota bacterium]
EPKSAKSRRAIALPDVAVDALKRHRVAQAEVRLALGGDYQDGDLVICCPDGTPYAPDNLSTAFAKLAERAGLPQCRLHDLRHTHATLLLRAKVHPKVVSERLGHSAVGITLDTYSHVLPGMQAEAAQSLNAALGTAMAAKLG